MSRRPELKKLWVVMLFSGLNALLWMTVIPFHQAPDEGEHFNVVRFEASHGRIPVVGVDDAGVTVAVASDGYRTPYMTYSAQPGLSYLFSAALVRLAGQ